MMTKLTKVELYQDIYSLRQLLVFDLNERAAVLEYVKQWKKSLQCQCGLFGIRMRAHRAALAFGILLLVLCSEAYVQNRHRPKRR